MNHLVAFALISFLVIVIPGPSVLFTVGRALTVGRREALLTVAGTPWAPTYRSLPSRSAPERWCEPRCWRSRS
jgi:hypothetical protein